MLKPIKSFLLSRRGRRFKTTSKVFFDAAYGAKGDYGQYMPDSAFRPLGRTNGVASRAILNDKLLFERVVGRYVPVPPILALIERGEVFAAGPNSSINTFEQLLEYTQTQALALKPALGQKGKGVYRLSWQEGFRLDGSPTQPAEIAALLEGLDYYLVVPWIPQDEYVASVFPEAGNTLRIVTMRDPGSDYQPFIAAAIQKFGTRISAPTDNWSQGALFAPIDVDTGVMVSALEALERTKGKPVWHEQHPDTGVPIKGRAVPRWAELTSALLALVEALPIFTYVGWDVMVTEKGFVVIEGNPAPAIVTLQLTRPALADPRVQRFVIHHQIAGVKLPSTGVKKRS